jgi:predicted RecA/RadA family phage recombinase
MKNFIQPGDNLPLIAPRTLTSGEGFLIASLFAVASAAAASGEAVEGVTSGVFDLAKSATVTPAVGGKAYWDDTAHSVTTSASGTTLIGVFTQAALAGDATCRVKLGIVA